MVIFVAGATGVLGRALARRLVSDNHTVRGIARRRRDVTVPAGLELIEADLLEDDLVDLVGGCDAVVHIATTVATDRLEASAPDGNARLRTVGTRRLLDAALACGVRRYVQQSLVIAYADGCNKWLDEQTPLDESPERHAVCGPVIEMEGMIREIESRRLAWTILRGGSFVGAGTREAALLDALRRGELVVHGDGSNYISLVNVIDMADAVTAAIELAPAGSTFNIVDEPIRYADYVDALADLIGVARPARVAEGPAPHCRRCTNKAARTVLGWMPRQGIWPYDGGL